VYSSLPSSIIASSALADRPTEGSLSPSTTSLASLPLLLESLEEGVEEAELSPAEFIGLHGGPIVATLTVATLSDA